VAPLKLSMGGELAEAAAAGSNPGRFRGDERPVSAVLGAPRQ
jgi:hypothetical protein